MNKLTKKIWELNKGDKVRFPKSYEHKIAYTDKDGNTTHKIINEVFIDRYPDFYLDVANHSGVVEFFEESSKHIHIRIKLDKHYSELDEFDNDLEFYGQPNNDEDWIENYDMEIIKENK